VFCICLGGRTEWPESYRDRCAYGSPEQSNCSRSGEAPYYAADSEVASPCKRGPSATARVWYVVRVTPYRTMDDRIEGVVITLVDVTALKRTESAMRESETRFRAVANLVPDLLSQSGPDDSALWFKDQWYAYTGQSWSEAEGFGWLDVVHPTTGKRLAPSGRARSDVEAAVARARVEAPSRPRWNSGARGARGWVRAGRVERW